MFHTFQATKSPEDISKDAQSTRPSTSRRITTSNACGSCRRRKIRCDGATPCGQCVYYQQADACHYSKPPPRVVPSRKLVEDLSASVQRYRLIFERLFPGRDVEELVSLSQEDLLAAVGIPAKDVSAKRQSELGSPASTLGSEGADSLETLIQAPEQDPALDEATRHQNSVQGISDDVNGLSLSLDRPSSYVGVSSITAALKVICRVAPATRRMLALGQTDTAIPSRICSPSPDPRSLSPTYLPPAELGQGLIDAYFDKVHPLMPMLDEHQFRQTWLYGERRDSAWLALLNTVLALGSVVSSDCTNHAHEAYYQRAMQLLDVDSLGSGNVLVVQALGLLSGYYLHYVSRPNLANNLMGATLRQATVLGLHREYTETSTADGSPTSISNSADVRRRTWWSLYVLDTWANTTTGRPSIGQLSRGITVHLPHIKDSQDPAMAKFLPLAYNVEFCKIATQIQDALSATPLLPFDELNRLDKELLQWFSDLPVLLKPSTHVATFQRTKSGRSTGIHDSPNVTDALKTTSMIIYWRYQNLRLLLHRPYLLATALRNVPETSLSAEEKVGVGRCKAVAARTIEDIAKMCKEEMLAGWNAVWFMYQAVMVPLVCVFSNLSRSASSSPHTEDQNTQDTGSDIPGSTPHSETSSSGHAEMQDWHKQIERALKFFERMNRWSAAAKKSRDVVSRLYDISKQLAEYNIQIKADEQNTSNDSLLQPPTVSTSTGLQADTTSNDDASLSMTASDMVTEDIWGLSPNGAAAMNNFWFDDMMWDVPVAETDLFGNTGSGFGYSELDWLSGLDPPNGDQQQWQM